MSTNHERRSRLVGFKIKQESWDLEDQKKNNRHAQDAAEAADKALEEIEDAIAATVDTLRRALTGELKIDLEVIQAARQFLVDQQDMRKRCQRDRQRARQKADQAEARLKQAVLYVKALKQVKESSDQVIHRDQENKQSEQLAELWRQRYGRSEWPR